MFINLIFRDKETFKAAFLEKVHIMHGKNINEASDSEKFTALATMVRDYLGWKWAHTQKEYAQACSKQVYYFSIEYLPGRLLGANLLNMDVREICAEGLSDLGIDLGILEEQEVDMGLGNGGLGRLAACCLESMAALQYPVHGYGIRYKYGLFKQQVVNGYQIEEPDNWLQQGTVWEFRRDDCAEQVRFGGIVRTEHLDDGATVFVHENYETVLAVPYDVPISGYHNNTVNTLRLWSAEAAGDEFDMSAFNRGDYNYAFRHKNTVGAISQVLYPEDSNHEGRVLRLKQQYFFVSAGIQNIIRSYKETNESIRNLHHRVAVHINDTHPTLVIPEIMRILMDEEGLGWEEAWHITSNTVSYTNHTILPEALEKWPIELLKGLFPRLYMIISEINERFGCELCCKFRNNCEPPRDVAIIADGQVRMAYLAVVGSHSVNGVAKIHSEILKNEVMKSFYNSYPYKFNNKTNGVNHRRWLLQANPQLAKLITDSIGSDWVNRPMQLSALQDYADDKSFQEQLFRVKQHNKQIVAAIIKNDYGIDIDTQSIFDVHIKRIHAYKRQLLNILHIMDLYNRLRENPQLNMIPRTFIFAGKAAPGYYQAKKIIKLINTVADVINNDRDINDKIKVVFLENYSVSIAEKLIPATDVSEQIPTASREASGTGVMKFMMNGAITIGTLDGANIEIWERVGKENLITFGLTANEVLDYYRYGGYRAFDVYHSEQRVQMVVDQLVNGFFPTPEDEFKNLVDSLLWYNDEFFVLKDFPDYAEAQQLLQDKFSHRAKWLNMCITNIALSGWFSSDRTFSEYATEIWDVRPQVIGMPGGVDDELFDDIRSGDYAVTRVPAEPGRGEVRDIPAATH